MKLIPALLGALLLTGSLGFGQARILGTHADTTAGWPPSWRIGQALTTVYDPAVPALAFQYNDAVPGSCLYRLGGIPAGNYDIRGHAPGYDANIPLLGNPTVFDPNGADVWRSIQLNANPNAPVMDFQLHPGVDGLIYTGTFLDLQFHGQPASSIQLLLTTTITSPALTLPGIGELYAVDIFSPTLFTMLDMGLLDQNGDLYTSNTIAPDPAYIGVQLYFQAMEVSISSGGLQLLLSNLLAIEFA